MNPRRNPLLVSRTRPSAPCARGENTISLDELTNHMMVKKCNSKFRDTANIFLKTRGDALTVKDVVSGFAADEDHDNPDVDKPEKVAAPSGLVTDAVLMPPPPVPYPSFPSLPPAYGYALHPAWTRSAPTLTESTERKCSNPTCITTGTWGTHSTDKCRAQGGPLYRDKTKARIRGRMTPTRRTKTPSVTTRRPQHSSPTPNPTSLMNRRDTLRLPS